MRVEARERKCKIKHAAKEKEGCMVKTKNCTVGSEREGRERYKARRKESCVTNGREKPRVESKADDRNEKRTYKVIYIYIRSGKWEVERKFLKK